MSATVAINAGSYAVLVTDTACLLHRDDGTSERISGWRKVELLPQGGIVSMMGTPPPWEAVREALVGVSTARDFVRAIASECERYDAGPLPALVRPVTVVTTFTMVEAGEMRIYVYWWPGGMARCLLPGGAVPILPIGTPDRLRRAGRRYMESRVCAAPAMNDAELSRHIRLGRRVLWAAARACPAKMNSETIAAFCAVTGERGILPISRR